MGDAFQPITRNVDVWGLFPVGKLAGDAGYWSGLFPLMLYSHHSGECGLDLD